MGDHPEKERIANPWLGGGSRASQRLNIVLELAAVCSSEYRLNLASLDEGEGGLQPPKLHSGFDMG